MKQKISLIAAVIAIQALVLGEVYATSTPQKSIQYYGGLSGGANRMGGKRTENVVVDATQELITFTNNLNVRDNNAQYSGFVGLSWFIPQTGIFLGPEIHLGKAHTEKKFQGYVNDPVTGNNRTLTSTFSQSIFWGGVINLGYAFRSYSGYVLLGGEGSRFQNYVTLNSLDPTLPPAFFKGTKWLKGVLWGFGFAKQVNCVKFGVEARFINYGAFRNSYADTIVGETVNTRFKPNNMRFSFRLSYLF